MSKTEDDDQRFTIATAIKNLERMSSELKRLIVKSQLFLCDLTLNVSHPRQADVSRTEEKCQDSEKLTIIKPASSVHYHSLLPSDQ